MEYIYSDYYFVTLNLFQSLTVWEIVVKHTAHSKAVFGKGAVEAAKYLKGKGPGMYTMKEVIG